MNSYEVTVPDHTLYQYDGKLISPCSLTPKLRLVASLFLVVGKSFTPHCISRLVLTGLIDDCTVTPDLSKKICQRLISKIREENPTIFTSPVFYDGRAILFSSHRLKLGPNGTSEVQEVTNSPFEL